MLRPNGTDLNDSWFSKISVYKIYFELIRAETVQWRSDLFASLDFLQNLIVSGFSRKRKPMKQNLEFTNESLNLKDKNSLEYLFLLCKKAVLFQIHL